MDQTRSRNSAGLLDKARALLGLSITAVSAALLAVAPAARAQVNITAAQTTPISTATANNNAPDDIIITTTGSISPTTDAVTINSNNNVTNNGAITITDTSSVSGIVAVGGFTGSITNTGTITNTASSISTAEPFVGGQFRFGIRVEQGTGAFNGGITQTAGSISIAGNNSAGIDIDPGATLNGTITLAATSISITGDNSYGILANGSITGGINFTGSITALGASTTAIQVNQAVGTQIYIDGTISATGFASTVRPTTTAAYQLLVPADLAIGGNAINVAAGVGQGIEIDSAGIIQSFGSAAALQIESNTPSVIGLSPTGSQGLLIIGGVASNGVYDNISATGVQIGGPVTITNGISVAGGSVTANAYAANATALTIGAGASVGSLYNGGTISANVQFGQGTNAAVGGVATAVVDNSGSLTSITNQGLISATSVSGATNPSSTIALDLRSNTTGVTVEQIASQSAIPASIVGDVLFGSGNATLDLESGTIKGNVAFGTGADNAFTLTGGTTMTGILTNQGGLALNVLGGTLQLTNPSTMNTVNLTSLTIGSAGQVEFAVDGAADKATEFIVSGNTTIAATGKIGLDFTSKVTTPESFTIVQTQTLTTGSPTDTLLVGNVPYFYDVALSSSSTSNGTSTIDVAVAPRTASNAGIVVGSSAFNAIFNAFDRDPSIESTFNHASTAQAFSHVYEQMLPDYAGGLFQGLLDGTDALTRAELGNSLYPAPANRTGAWLEEFGFGVDRSRDQAPGYHGGGLGFALGWENSLSKLTQLGYAVSYMRGSVDDVDSGPNNRAIGTVYAFGAYLKRDLSDVGQGLKADASVNIGYAPLKSTREFDGVDATGANFVRSASANWNGAVGNAHLELSYEENLGDFFVRPHVAGDYFALYEEGRQERNGGNAFDLSIASQTSKEGSGEVGLTIGTEFGSDFIWRPQVTVGWKQIFGGPDNTVAQFVSGGQAFTLTPQALDRGGYFGRFEMHGGDHYTDISFQAGGESFGDYHAFDGKFTARFRF